MASFYVSTAATADHDIYHLKHFSSIFQVFQTISPQMHLFCLFKSRSIKLSLHCSWIIWHKSSNSTYGQGQLWSQKGRGKRMGGTAKQLRSTNLTSFYVSPCSIRARDRPSIGYRDALCRLVLLRFRAPSLSLNVRLRCSFFLPSFLPPFRSDPTT